MEVIFLMYIWVCHPDCFVIVIDFLYVVFSRIYISITPYDCSQDRLYLRLPQVSGSLFNLAKRIVYVLDIATGRKALTDEYHSYHSQYYKLYGLILEKDRVSCSERYVILSLLWESENFHLVQVTTSTVCRQR